MSEFLTRAGALFLAPEAPIAPAQPSVEPRAPQLVAVLAPSADLVVASGAVAADLRRAARSRTVVVCGPAASPTPATPAATRLARRLAARDVEAVAAGSLCRVRVSTERDFWRAAGAAETPVVLALPGRGDGLDDLLAQMDRLVLATRADEDAALTGLAMDSLRRVGPSATHVTVPTGLVRRIAAALGFSPIGASAPEAVAGVTRERGQALVLLTAGLCALLLGTFVLGAVARGIGHRSDAQRAADLAALAGARAMLGAYPRLFEPATTGGRTNAHHMSKTNYLAIGRRAATVAARRNGARDPQITFPDADTLAPVRIAVRVTRRVEVGRAGTYVTAAAEAALSPVTAGVGPGAAGGEYRGPLAIRQGKPMRPDVAAAFDRMERAARADGVALIINSAYRSDAEQAVLFARRPDPKWVAPPGRSLHRHGTELDLGPSAAYPWLAANAPRFHFVQRYAWEPWHWGYALNAKSSPAAMASAPGDGRGSIPSFVPQRFASPIARAARRYNVSATLLSAQLYAESGFNPFAVSPAGARGIAQFMPGTAVEYGLRNPFDAGRAIDAQARLMRDLLRRFAAVPLALAAYNAGPARVQACMCVPPIAETTGYVARILGLMSGGGDVSGGGLGVRLVA